MKCFGILPMAGKGARLQPIAFSKELYPVVYQGKHFAISEFCVKALLKARVDEIKLVVNPEKLDIARFYAVYPAPLSLYFYASPSLPESCLFPTNSLHDEDICLFGLPDTLFSPFDSFVKLRTQLEKGADLCLGLFQVKDGSQFDSVSVDKNNHVQAVLVKQSPPLSNWVWGIWGAKVVALKLLKKEVERQKIKKEKWLGVAFDSLAKKRRLRFQALKLGRHYFDVGNMEAVIKVNQVINHFSF